MASGGTFFSHALLNTTLHSYLPLDDMFGIKCLLLLYIGTRKHIPACLPNQETGLRAKAGPSHNGKFYPGRLRLRARSTLCLDKVMRDTYDA